MGVFHAGNTMQGMVRQARIELVERLRARQAEIEQAVLNRVSLVVGKPEVAGPEYAEGVRAAVAAAIAYCLATLEAGEAGSPSVPSALLAQARLSARSGVSLDAVLRRYFAGNTVFGDFLVEEIRENDPLGGPVLKHCLRVQANLFDNLIAVIAEEYAREAGTRTNSAAERRAERIERLLAGELVDASELAYDFDGSHLGLIAIGVEAEQALRALAAPLDCRLLVVSRRGETVWAWLGARRKLESSEVKGLSLEVWPCGTFLAIGEAARGLPGWRLSHRQARAAMPVALRGAEPVVRYSDVIMLASMLQDDLLTTSLRQLYLAPLELEQNSGETARETLRAYFAADRNVSSAAAALGTTRRTVGTRLRAVEKSLGRPLSAIGVELEAALRIDELDRRTPPRDL